MENFKAFIKITSKEGRSRAVRTYMCRGAPRYK
jgi:hypothetical protein